MRTVGDSMGDGVLDRPPGQLDGQDHGQVRVCASGPGSGGLGVECAGACVRVEGATGGTSIRPIINALFTILR